MNALAGELLRTAEAKGVKQITGNFFAKDSLGHIRGMCAMGVLLTYYGTSDYARMYDKAFLDMFGLSVGEMSSICTKNNAGKTYSQIADELVVS